MNFNKELDILIQNRVNYCVNCNQCNFCNKATDTCMLQKLQSLIEEDKELLSSPLLAKNKDITLYFNHPVFTKTDKGYQISEEQYEFKKGELFTTTSGKFGKVLDIGNVSGYYQVYWPHNETSGYIHESVMEKINWEKLHD